MKLAKFVGDERKLFGDLGRGFVWHKQANGKGRGSMTETNPGPVPISAEERGGKLAEEQERVGEEPKWKKWGLRTSKNDKLQ